MTLREMLMSRQNVGLTPTRLQSVPQMLSMRTNQLPSLFPKTQLAAAPATAPAPQNPLPASGTDIPQGPFDPGPTWPGYNPGYSGPPPVKTQPNPYTNWYDDPSIPKGPFDPDGKRPPQPFDPGPTWPGYTFKP